MRRLLLIAFSVLLALSAARGQAVSDRWAEVREAGAGTLVVAYSENSPFIYKTAQGEQAGIEYEILEDFKAYLAEVHEVEINLTYEHLYNFESLIDTLKASSRPLLGIASISTLEERKTQFNITETYMPDIEIIISSRAFESVSNLAEFADMVKNNRAITVSNSTFERNILELQRDYFPEINLEYVRTVDVLIEEVSSSRDAWGYISLPNYLSYLENGKSISRQRFFVVENLGLSMATPLHSDWAGILDEYFATERFKEILDILIEKHLGPVFGEVVWSISNLNNEADASISVSREVGVLTLERELQDLKLKQSELELSRKNVVITLVSIGIVLVLIVLVFLYGLVRLKVSTNKSLEEKNRQIEAQNQALNELNHEKNELIGIVAHDLKNPLTSAMSVTQLLDEETETEDHKEYLGLLHRSLNRMNNLVAKILEIKVLESPSVEVNKTETDLKKLAEQVIASLRIHAENKQISIEQELDEVMARTDSSMVIQILDNLLSNAIKFSPHNTRVTVRLVHGNPKIRLEVEDEGPGISPEDMPRLFKKFQKLSARPSDGENSTGLGLSIVKKYVEALDGKVWCEAGEQQGARFVVEI
jgi:signal transduction histidine kinase/ABC-type amino acid transport substrate-binding protein